MPLSSLSKGPDSGIMAKSPLHDDPFEWDSRTLARKLCASANLWPSDSLAKIPDLRALSTSIVDHGIDGAAVLKSPSLFRSTTLLFQHLAVTNFNHQSSFLEVIYQLQANSPRYLEWKGSFTEPVRLRSQDESVPRAELPVEPPSFPSPLAINDPTRAFSLERSSEPNTKKRKLTSSSLSSHPRSTITPSTIIPMHPRDQSNLQKMSSVGAHAYLGAGPVPDEDITMPLPRYEKLSTHIRSHGVDFCPSPLAAGDPLAAAGRRVLVQRMMRKSFSRFADVISLIPRSPDLASKEKFQGESLSQCDDPVLPLYGHSEDESVSSELYREILQDEPDTEDAVNAPVSLSQHAVGKIIDSVIQEIEDKWRAYRLPKHVAKANRRWKRAHLAEDERIREAIQQKVITKKLETHIKKIRQELLGLQYTSVMEARYQASSLEQSVHNRLYHSWLFRTLSAPRRRSKIAVAPIKSSERPRPLLPVDCDLYDEYLTSDTETESIESDADPVGMNDKTQFCQQSRRHVSPATAPGLTPDNSDVIDLTMDDSDEELQPLHTLFANHRSSSQPEKKPLISQSPERHQDESGIRIEIEEDCDQGESAPWTDTDIDQQDRVESRIPEMEVSSTIPYDRPRDIASMTCLHWEEVGDAIRLLICLIWELKSIQRGSVFDIFNANTTPNQLWDCAVAGPIEMRRCSTDPRDEKQGFLVACFLLIQLFMSYADCKVISKKPVLVLSSRRIREIVSASSKWLKFCSTMHTIIPYFTIDLLPLAYIPQDPDEDLIGPVPLGCKKLIVNQEALTLRKSQIKRQDIQAARRKKLDQELLESDSVQHDKTHLIINMSKEADQGFIYVHPQIASHIMKHQVEGVRFMWNEIIGDTSMRQGCLLAHTMGLGKTMQVITFLTAIAEAASSQDLNISSQIPSDLTHTKALVLCPPGLVQNWQNEFSRWAPADLIGKCFSVEASMPDAERHSTIQLWASEGGIMVIGYNLFKTFVLEKKGRGEADDQPCPLGNILTQFPDIVVADEAHIFKNLRTGIRRAMSTLRTTCRIALTGSPLANNVREYYAMIDWIAPNYLGPFDEFNATYAAPIEIGLYAESTPMEKRQALYALHILTGVVARKMDRATVHKVMKTLPVKHEFAIRVPLLPLQQKLYDALIDSVLHKTEEYKGASLFDVVDSLALICNHPCCFHVKCKDVGDKSFTLSETMRRAGLLLGTREDIADPALSWRLRLLCRILDECKSLGDKVLIFSHHIPTLDYLENLLRTQNLTYLRMDGSTPIRTRQSMVDVFNQGQNEVFLSSTKAGGVGLNMQTANRVVIFDFGWNPVDEQQAVARAYRIGQEKPVFVYRFVSGGTIQDGLENRAIFKMQLAARVVDKTNPISGSRRWTKLIKPRREPDQEDLSQFDGKDPVLDSLIKDQNLSPGIRSIVKMETFEAEDVDSCLTADDHKNVADLVKLANLRRTEQGAYQKRHEGGEAQILPTGLPSPESQPVLQTVGDKGEDSTAASGPGVHGTTTPSHETLPSPPNSTLAGIHIAEVVISPEDTPGSPIMFTAAPIAIPTSVAIRPDPAGYPAPLPSPPHPTIHKSPDETPAPLPTDFVRCLIMTTNAPIPTPAPATVAEMPRPVAAGSPAEPLTLPHPTLARSSKEKPAPRSQDSPGSSLTTTSTVIIASPIAATAAEAQIDLRAATPPASCPAPVLGANTFDRQISTPPRSDGEDRAYTERTTSRAGKKPTEDAATTESSLPAPDLGADTLHGQSSMRSASDQESDLPIPKGATSRDNNGKRAENAAVAQALYPSPVLGANTFYRQSSTRQPSGEKSGDSKSSRTASRIDQSRIEDNARQVFVQAFTKTLMSAWSSYSHVLYRGTPQQLTLSVASLIKARRDEKNFGFAENTHHWGMMSRIVQTNPRVAVALASHYWDPADVAVANKVDLDREWARLSQLDEDVFLTDVRQRMRS